jgi:hypothetical protein
MVTRWLGLIQVTWKKEWRVLVRDRATTWSTVLLLILGVFSQVYGIVALSRLKGDSASLQEATRQSHEYHLNSAKSGKLRLGAYLSKIRFPHESSAPPISALAFSSVERFPHEMEVSIKAHLPQLFTPSYFNPLLPALGFLDFLGILAVALPLWILSLSFNLTSKEREQGTLRQIEAEEIGSVFPLAIKFLVVALFVMMIILSLNAAGIMLTSPMKEWTAWISRTLTPVLTYASTWLALGLMVSLLKLSTFRSSVVAIFIWTGLTWLKPAVHSLANATNPHGKAIELLTSHRVYLNAFWEKERIAPLNQTRDPPKWMSQALSPAKDEFTWGWFYSAHEASDLQFMKSFMDLQNESAKHRDAIRSSSLSGRFELSMEQQLGLDETRTFRIHNEARAFRQRLQEDLIPRMAPDVEISTQEITNIITEAVRMSN